MDYTTNPRAHYDYEILETVEAGIVLEGHEVRAIKTGRASIKGSYVKIINEKPCLIGATISPYQPANTPKNYDAQRSRQLLLSKKEILDLISTARTKKATFIPLKFYGKHNRVKLLIGIARGKKKYDKREIIKEKDIARARQRGIEE